MEHLGAGKMRYQEQVVGGQLTSQITAKLSFLLKKKNVQNAIILPSTKLLNFMCNYTPIPISAVCSSIQNRLNSGESGVLRRKPNPFLVSAQNGGDTREGMNGKRI